MDFQQESLKRFIVLNALVAYDLPVARNISVFQVASNGHYKFILQMWKYDIHVSKFRLLGSSFFLGMGIAVAVHLNLPCRTRISSRVLQETCVA